MAAVPQFKKHTVSPRMLAISTGVGLMELGVTLVSLSLPLLRQARG